MDTIIDNPFSVIDRRLNRIENLLLDLKQYAPAPQAQAEPQSDLIGIKETAKLLGWAISTIYTKNSRRILPFPCRKNDGMKQLFFSRAEVLAYRDSMKEIKTKEKISSEAKEAQVKK